MCSGDGGTVRETDKELFQHRLLVDTRSVHTNEMGGTASVGDGDGRIVGY